MALKYVLWTDNWNETLIAISEFRGLCFSYDSRTLGELIFNQNSLGLLATIASRSVDYRRIRLSLRLETYKLYHQEVTFGVGISITIKYILVGDRMSIVFSILTILSAHTSMCFYPFWRFITEVPW